MIVLIALGGVNYFLGLKSECGTENWCRCVQGLSDLNVTQWNLWMEGQRIMMQSYWRLVTKAMCPIGLRCDT